MWVSVLVLFQMVFTNTNRGMVKIGYFYSKFSKFYSKCQSLSFSQYHPLVIWFINKQVKSICCYCFPSICNWWYQGELGFCCRDAETCINIYGRFCVYNDAWFYIPKDKILYLVVWLFTNNFLLKDFQQISICRFYAGCLLMYAVAAPFELLLKFP